MSTSKPNVLQKMNQAKKMFATAKVAKSGYNQYSKYEYFTLEDITPTILQIFDELGLYGLINFANGDHPYGCLEIFNLDDETMHDKMLVTIPMAFPNLSASNAQANIGASVTYLRRYLWLTALEIVEADAIDSTEGAPVDKRPAPAATRAKAKEDVVASTGSAPKRLVTRVETLATELKEKGTKADKTYLAKVLKATEKFTSMTKEQAEEIISEMVDRVAKLETDGADG